MGRAVFSLRESLPQADVLGLAGAWRRADGDAGGVPPPRVGKARSRCLADHGGTTSHAAGHEPSGDQGGPFGPKRLGRGGKSLRLRGFAPGSGSSNRPLLPHSAVPVANDSRRPPRDPSRSDRHARLDPRRRHVRHCPRRAGPISGAPPCLSTGRAGLPTVCQGPNCSHRSVAAVQLLLPKLPAPAELNWTFLCLGMAARKTRSVCTAADGYCPRSGIG